MAAHAPMNGRRANLPAWGKTDLASVSGSSHHLAHHSGDVALVFSELLKQPVFRRRAETALRRRLTDAEVECLSALAFLHDIGKLAPVFQAKGWPDGHGLLPLGHLQCGYLWLMRLDPATALDGTLSLLRHWPELPKWFEILFAHHGRPVPTPSRTDRMDAFRPVPGYDWRAEELRMGQALRAWFPAIRDHAPPPPAPQFAHYICGLLALADWIGSDRRGFDFVAEFDANYGKQARDRARKRLREIGLAAGGCALRGSEIWPLIAPDYPLPRPAQATVGALDQREQLVILEAETGSGKTEAALWRFAALFHAGEVESLYFAVPTRAAARQLHGRVTAVARRMLDPAPEPVLAIPGQRVAGDAVGTPLPGFDTRWDDDDPHPGRWAAEHATRFLAAQIAVGTVDQVMMAGLQVKHAHLRGTALARALLVIDEVHASDAYMTRIQHGLARAHLALGGHVMLMSATLGSAARSLWRGEATPSLEAAAAHPYPAVWTGDQCLAVDETGAGKDVVISARPGWSGADAAELALAAAREGARVLVIRNTVDRARETWTAVAAQAPELLLSVSGVPSMHHSRFAAEDRALLDRAVEEALGRHSLARGCIVIGTQTLEQSLDIDADFLVSDLCPMDVLLQRIGRLHRHQRDRPKGYRNATAVVLIPNGGLDRLTRTPENGLGGAEWSASLSGVYVDVPCLAATLEQIEKNPLWRIPAMNRALVEAATHPEALDRVATANGWEDYRQRTEGKALAEMNAAGLVELKRDEPLPKSFPDDERIRTRLGEEGVMLSLPEGTRGPFGTEIRTITLPPHWSHGLKGNEEIEIDFAAALSMTVSDRAFGYDATGLTRGRRE
jgi:CRISPR-associated endonuclease/helicase Cas3